MRLAVVQNGRELGKDEGRAVLIEVSRGFRERQHEKARAHPRYRYEPTDRSSVRRLADAVEARLVTALWTLARLPSGASSGRCGLPYMHSPEEVRQLANATGEWMKMKPGSPLPKEIDAMHEPLSWLGWLPRDVAVIVRAGANSKEGQPEANVSWGRVRAEAPSARGLTVITLQRRYKSGLDAIATELAFRGQKV